MDKQMKIGENSDLVIEILDFIANEQLLKPSGRVTLNNIAIMDLDVAKKFAWDETYGEEEFTWADLRSEKMSEVWSVIYNNYDKYSEIDNKLSSLLDQINSLVSNQLEQQSKELLDDIVSDMHGCLLSRAVQGRNNNFFENIFSAYLKGGWPCGWKGDWPSGEVITYLSRSN